MPRPIPGPSEIHPAYIAQRLRLAEATEAHFRTLFAVHAQRLLGAGGCLDRFRASVDALRRERDESTLRAVEESHNELCIAEELLLYPERPFSMIEYEPPLPCGDQRVDFRATDDRSVRFVEVKTIHPELKDRWDQYKGLVQAGHITDNVTIHFEKQWMGGQLWHQKFSARTKMLEYSLEFEDRIQVGGIDSPRNVFVLAFFTDGFAWHEDELEDFVAFYRTGEHRLDDGLAKMEGHTLESEGRSLTRRISTFAYFWRPPFEQAPTVKNWNVRQPAESW